jgi:hypothetical protein
MIPIVYFNLSDTSSDLYPAGSVVEIADLLQARRADRILSPDAKDILDQGVPANLDPTGRKRPHRWEQLVSAIICSLSGHLPSRAEVLRGRQILMALPKSMRSTGRVEQISFAFLPYFLTAVKTHLGNGFVADSNGILDAAAFIRVLMDSEEPVISSFLCAHRAATLKGTHALIDQIDKAKARKAMNCIRGISENRGTPGCFRIHWYQQGATEWASSNMFPEMFLSYLTTGRIPEMLERLELHFSQIQGITRDATTFSSRAGLLPLDAVTLKIIRLLEERYGEWRRLIARPPSNEDSLMKIAQELALPVVHRLMPLYSEDNYGLLHHNERATYSEVNLLRVSDQSDRDLVVAAIERFFDYQMIEPLAKALYEAAFYYLWGRSTGEMENGLAFGIDRDHASFQHKAWSLGYEEARSGSRGVPLVYARRVGVPNPSSSLRGYTVRQFWR